MIKEENIERLSEEQRQAFLDDGAKLGLYSHEGKLWYERVYITDKLSLHNHFIDILNWRMYHEWQEPQKTKTRPMNALEIASFCQREGVLLCSCLNGDILYNASIQTEDYVGRFRYLKDGELHKFDEIEVEE